MMAPVVKWILLFLGCLVVQTTLVYHAAIAGILPDLPLLALFVFSLKFGSIPGLYVGFVLGLTQDLFSPSLLGQHALATTVAGFFVGLFNEKIMRTDAVLKMVILLLAFLVHDILFISAQIIRAAGAWALLPSSLVLKTIPRSLYSAVVVALFYLWDLFLKPSMRR